MKDYYTILEIRPDSTESDIRKAYRRLAKKYHPDVNTSKDAREKFIKIAEAYEFLISQKYYMTVKPSPDSTFEDRTYKDYRTSEEYKQFLHQVREKAQHQAKMRYEEFRKQHEAFQESGINDIALLFKMIFRFTVIPLIFFLLLIPVYLMIYTEWTMIFLSLITWTSAGILAFYVQKNRKQYFMPGEFYYSPERIRQIYTEVNPTEQKCYYCPSESADSKPFRLDLLKLKGVKIKTEGFRQHNASYINEKATILVPRSRKAFIVHSLITFLKVTSILSCIVFMDITSIVWRVIIGMLAGGIISSLILLLTGTKSNVSYILSHGFVVRICIWMLIIVMISQFSIEPFNINTSDFIHFVVVGIIIFDSFLMQFVNYFLGKYASKPIIRQQAEIDRKFKDGYKLYNDVPIISVIYPLYKWVFG